MMTVVGSSFMARTSKIQRGTAILGSFLSTRSVPVRVWDETRALARPDHRGDKPLKPGRFIMRKQSDQQREPSAALHLWTYDAAVRAVPYLRAVVRSLRERWLHLQSVRRQIERLDSHPGRPDRQILIRRTLAVKELDQADIELEETFAELKAIDVYCLDPAQGLA